MKELSTIENYAELKETLRDELNNQSLGFVRTGYLLKRARDTGMIEEGGYKTVFEFAEAEYGLKKDVVSRYIAINDRYSEGGYSDKLAEQFRGYGVGKLQDMLNMPMEIVNMISPQMTRREIGELKAELKAEEAVTPMELLMEGKNEKQCGMDICQKAMHQYCHDYPEKFIKMADAFREETDHDTAVRLILDAMAPSGIKMVTARVQGEGRFMISFQGEQAPVEIKQVQGGEHMVLSWPEFLERLREVLKGTPGTEGAEYWESIYQEAFPQEEKKIPEKEEDKKKEETKQKPSHVTEEKSEKASVRKNPGPEERQQDQRKKKLDRKSAGETEEPEKKKVAPVQQNPEKEEAETVTRQQDSREEAPEEPEENGEEVLSGEVENQSDGVDTEHETDSPAMTEEEFQKRMEEYRETFSDELEGAGHSIGDYNFTLTRRFLRDATDILNKMEQLDDKYEEYQL